MNIKYIGIDVPKETIAVAVVAVMNGDGKPVNDPCRAFEDVLVKSRRCGNLQTLRHDEESKDPPSEHENTDVKWSHFREPDAVLKPQAALNAETLR